MSARDLLMSANAPRGGEGVDIADAIDFDGTNDYLRLISSTFASACTLSFWLYVPDANAHKVFQKTFTNGQGALNILAVGGNLTVTFYNNNGGQTQAGTKAVSLPVGTFNHILISGSLSGAGTLGYYINDVSQGGISLSADALGVGEAFYISRWSANGAGNAKCRIAHFYLKNNSLDLTIEANRRLFITADRKPAANQAALNPILYLPLNDPTQPGKNLGTGGDFTLTGVVARSGRGPNQFNAPYSDLDGSADYLSRTTALSGISSSKTVTLHFCFEADAGFASGRRILAFRNASNLQIFQVLNQSGKLRIIADSTPNNADALVLDIHTIVTNRNYIVTVSFDLSDTGKRHVLVNGEVFSATWTTYANLNIAFGSATSVSVGAFTTSNLYDGRLGNVFFDTRYIDLSQPDNLAKFVTGTGSDAKPVDLGANGELPFGTPPLIYLPMYGNNAGKNYGTGGDFTVNSGPFPGARGPNEFWGNLATIPAGTGGYLSRSSITGLSNGTTFSFAAFFVGGTTGVYYFFTVPGDTAGWQRLVVQMDNGQLKVRVSNSAESAWELVFSSTSTSLVTLGVRHCLMVSRSGTTLRTYLDGVSIAGTTSSNSGGQMTVSGRAAYAGVERSTTRGTGQFSIAEFFFTTDYIDFSQEANRLKFRDAFGNPVDLTPQIEAGEIPNPAIYMRFDPANFGKNSGTGGDFTVNGTITDGGQL